MLALDVEQAEDAEYIVSTHREYIDAVKIGTTLLVSPTGGTKIISTIRKKYDLPVLVDSKLKDVPHVLLSTIRSYRSLGATGVTVWADVGKETLRTLIRGLTQDSEPIDLMVLTALTILPLDQIEESAKSNILMSVECGVQFLQVPGNYPELITWARKNIPPEVMVMSCGVGLCQGGIIGEAINCGADYEIIGRHILDSEDSEDMAEAFKTSSKIIRENLRLQAKSRTS
jgi:orotidine-5'-phosphate decarboxylase